MDNSTREKSLKESMKVLDHIFNDQQDSLYLLIVLGRDGDLTESMHVGTDISAEYVPMVLSTALQRVLTNHPTVEPKPEDYIQ
jgi:hypothetical protein